MTRRYQDDFPALAQRVNGHNLHYLDNAATALKPRAVIDAIASYYSDYSANVHRGLHTLSERATAALEHARETVRSYINASSPESIIFTSGTTESLNGAAHILQSHLHAGDEILVTQLEHHSNVIPWMMLAKATGAIVRFVPITDDGNITLEAVSKCLSKKTKILAITMMSNVLGTIPDMQPIITAARGVGVYVVLDAAQYVVHNAVDVQALDCDFLAFSGHKLYGPTGIGMLYGKLELLQTGDPWKGGGGMIREVSETDFIASGSPARYEAGTPPIAQAIGFGAALEYIQGIGPAVIQLIEQKLARSMHEQLKEIPEVTTYGNNLDSTIASFNIANVHAHDVTAILDHNGIATRAGHHCAQPLMNRLGIAGTTRASLAFYNTTEDIDALIRGIKEVIIKFK